MLEKIMKLAEEEKPCEPKSLGRKFKIGIIGTGWIAESHVQSYKKCPDVEIVAAADLIPGKAEAFMERFGVKGVRFYKDHKEMIDNEPELDGVSICTYNTQHAIPTIYALEHNINVLLEKPFTVTLEEAEAVCKAEAASKAFVSVGFQPRFDEHMKLIKKIVQAGILGKIYYIQTGGGRRRGIPSSTFIEKSTAGIGAVGDIGCYALDVVLNAIGYPKPLTVSGVTCDYFGKDPEFNGVEDAARFSVDDFAAALIRLEGGITLDFRIAWAMHVNCPGDTIIFGTDAALRIPATDCWNYTIGGPMTLYYMKNGGQTQVEIPMKKNPWDNIGEHGERLIDMKIRSFLNAIVTGGPAPVPTSQILYNQAIIDGIVRSSACGHEVEIRFAD